MAEFRTLTPDLAVAGQLDEADIEAAARQGFRTIINNRPDGEDGQQPENERLATVARDLGLEWRFLPVRSGDITEENIDEFDRLLAGVPLPALAFCRTGTRCTMLWALSQVQRRGLEEVVGAATSAGYDMSGARARLQERQRRD